MLWPTDRRIDLLGDLLSEARERDVRPWEPLDALVDEATYWLTYPEEVAERPNNLRSLGEEMQAALRSLGPESKKVLGSLVGRLVSSLRRVGEVEKAERPIIIEQMLQVLPVLDALLNTEDVRTSAWRDLVDVVQNDEVVVARRRADFFRSVGTRTGYEPSMFPSGPVFKDGVFGPPAAWAELTEYGEEVLRTPVPRSDQVVYTSITKAAPGLDVLYAGPLTLYGAIWLRQVLDDPSNPFYHELPQELTADNFFERVELSFLPDEPTNDLAVARIELESVWHRDAKDEARRLLEAVLSVASLRIRPGTWMVGELYAMPSGSWGHWETGAGPSTLVPGYVAEELESLRDGGELGTLTRDVHNTGPVSRAATSLAGIYSALDADVRLVESVRAIEHLFVDTAADWRDLVRRDLAPWWGGSLVADWACDVVTHAARDALLVLDREHDRRPAVHRLASNRSQWRRDVLDRAVDLRDLPVRISAWNEADLREVLRWLEEPVAMSVTARREEQAFRRRVKRVIRLRNGLTHLGRPPKRILYATSASAYGLAQTLCLQRLKAESQGVSLPNYIGRLATIAQSFHGALDQGNIGSAVSIV